MTHPKNEQREESDAPAGSNSADGVEAVEVTEEGAPQTELEEARAQAEENRNLYLRAVADLDNYRRRSVREREELRQFAKSGLMEDLLPILDNLALGIASARQQTDSEKVADGVAMVLDQLKGILNRSGLEEINPRKGDTFDPHQHESMAHQPSEEIPAEAISEVIRVGYSLNGRLLRPASVVLSSGPAENTESAD